MATLKISNANKVYVDFESRESILHVFTHLPRALENPTYCPVAKRALVRDVEAQTFAQGLGGYQIHWSDGPGLEHGRDA